MSASGNGKLQPDTKIKQEAAVSEVTLKSCTREEIEDVRYHILKFQSQSKVNFNKFTQPVRLHRKDPTNLQFQLTRKEIDERRASKKADKLANEESLADSNKGTGSSEQHGADMSVVAPDGGARLVRRANFFRKKTKQVRMVDDQKRKIRYEEYYPWVLEDYDGENTFVGNYEAGNPDTYVLLVFDNDGFKMIPAEKVYKFTPRNKYATLTLEEAEAKMEKNSKVPRWLMKHMKEDNAAVSNDIRFQRMRTVVGGNKSSKNVEDDDLDFDEEFADDEEAPIMDGNEQENKESEKRMRLEMSRANNVGDLLAEDNDNDLDDLFESRKVNQEGKKLKKVLVKQEKNDIYESDDEENPYLSKSESEEEEEQQEPDVKKEGTEGFPSIKTSTASPLGRKSLSPSLGPKIRVASYKQGYITLKAARSVLKEFPEGEWNPYIVKREIGYDGEIEENSPSKRVKLENSSDSEYGIITEKDVVDIIMEKPLKLKDLISTLKHKIHKHPDNKERLKNYVKKLCRFDQGLLYLKDSV
ncbi:Transcription initiation factor IIF subunit alpha [Komagataella phaffii CBS 7435]|uniref:Transcription initiation factor IIF subunit alpha n=2 Tax=Komagataella phaffii TaxID=460519 RepID=C4R848_KOMPG|nr:TFIIF (Transcription Factor II) largest subunit [Komagataella phaffii GS115]AOA64816.1 GQ67_04883T0 [Komagataella phaffii]CAH2450835.1 Transcription initiation factor IIF subunit alpha [Komagataella phaffii CBS 7435]AOA69831.1 GQ68_04855T0 [Komagataella phaffii GS115]CAY71773.1 TFIIF (Transcription Factor II) largest subunit [Komagataella phaffii GS115]CCA40626.1 Transcription initiation factor IIF subunit alpha [Komagataella phaffii CBS 7435]